MEGLEAVRLSQKTGRGRPSSDLVGKKRAAAAFTKEAAIRTRMRKNFGTKSPLARGGKRVRRQIGRVLG